MYLGIGITQKVENINNPFLLILRFVKLSVRPDGHRRFLSPFVKGEFEADFDWVLHTSFCSLFLGLYPLYLVCYLSVRSISLPRGSPSLPRRLHVR
ncbi:hypothetical protein S83_034934 [Arachis hypogaea]